MKRIYITIISCLSFFASSYADVRDYSFKDIVSMSVSDELELRDKDDQYTQFLNGTINVSAAEIVFQQKGLGNMESSSYAHYCRILIDILEGEDGDFPFYNDSNFSEEDFRFFKELADGEIEDAKMGLKEMGKEEMADKYGYVSLPKVTIEKTTSGLVYANVHYVRTGFSNSGTEAVANDLNVVVDICLFFNSKYALKAIFAYREKEKNLWLPILNQARNSLMWTHLYENETQESEDDVASFIDSSSDKKNDIPTDPVSRPSKKFPRWIFIIIGIVLYSIFKKKLK